MKDKRVEYIDVLRGVTMILLFPRLLDKILPLDIKKYFFLFSFNRIFRTFNYVENRLHLRKIQKHLVFHSVCTTFAAEKNN